MNRDAEKHLVKARDYLAKGDEFYRKAKPEIEAAVAAGASHREVARFLSRSHTWVRDVLAWDGKDTLYATDTERRQLDMAKQVLREAPMEQVERIVQSLPQERQSAIGAAAGDAYMGVRHGHDERERDLSASDRKAREAGSGQVAHAVASIIEPFTVLSVINDLEKARLQLKEMISDHVLKQEGVSEITVAFNAFADELNVARAMVGLDASTDREEV